MVYLVLNEALHHNSSYFGCIEVTKDEETAKVVIETCVKDILSDNILGDNVKTYCNNEIEKLGYNTNKGVLLINDLGFYELFYIEEKNII